MKLVNQIIIVTLIGSLLAAVASRLMPDSAGWTDGWTILQLSLASSSALLFFNVMAAIIFILGTVTGLTVGIAYLKPTRLFFRTDEY